MSVVLIPERKEYEEAQLSDALWFNDEDYQNIQKETLDELHQYILDNPHVSKKQALQLIYDLEGVHPDNLGIK